MLSADGFMTALKSDDSGLSYRVSGVVAKTNKNIFLLCFALLRYAPRLAARTFASFDATRLTMLTFVATRTNPC